MPEVGIRWSIRSFPTQSILWPPEVPSNFSHSVFLCSKSYMQLRKRLGESAWAQMQLPSRRWKSSLSSLFTPLFHSNLIPNYPVVPHQFGHHALNPCYGERVWSDYVRLFRYCSGLGYLACDKKGSQGLF